MALEAQSKGLRQAPPSSIYIPTFPEMIHQALDALHSEKGTNQVAITDYIERTYGTELPRLYRSLIASHLTRMAAIGELQYAGDNYFRPNDTVEDHIVEPTIDESVTPSGQVPSPEDGVSEVPDNTKLADLRRLLDLQLQMFKEALDLRLGAMVKPSVLSAEVPRDHAVVVSEEDKNSAPVTREADAIADPLLGADTPSSAITEICPELANTSPPPPKIQEEAVVAPPLATRDEATMEEGVATTNSTKQTLAGSCAAARAPTTEATQLRFPFLVAEHDALHPPVCTQELAIKPLMVAALASAPSRPATRRGTQRSLRVCPATANASQVAQMEVDTTFSIRGDEQGAVPLSFDAAFNYKTETTLGDALALCFTEGIDVYFTPSVASNYLCIAASWTCHVTYGMVSTRLLKCFNLVSSSAATSAVCLVTGNFTFDPGIIIASLSSGHMINISGFVASNKIDEPILAPDVLDGCQFLDNATDLVLIVTESFIFYPRCLKFMGSDTNLTAFLEPWTAPILLVISCDNVFAGPLQWHSFSLRSASTSVAQSSSAGFWFWLTGARSNTLPPPDFTLPGVTVPSSLADDVGPGKTKIPILPNGLKIASQATAGPNCSVGIYVDGGSVYETSETTSACQLLKKMALATTIIRGQLRLVHEIEAIGGTFKTSASREMMSYNYEALKSYMPKMVEVFIDCVRNPSFLDWEVTEEISKLQAELAKASSNPETYLLDALHSTGCSGALANPLFASGIFVGRLNTNVLEYF